MSLRIPHIHFPNDRPHDFWLRTLTEIDCIPLEARRNAFWTIYLIEAGDGVVHIDTDTQQLREGCVIMLTPTQVYQFQPGADLVGTMICLRESFPLHGKELQAFSTELYRYFLLDNSTVFRIKERIFARYVQIINWSKAALAENEWLSADIAQQYINIFCSELRRLFRTAEFAPKTSPDADLFLKFCALVNERYRTSTKAKDYPRLLSCDYQKLNQISKKYASLTVLQYIDTRILNEAKRLLVYTPMSIKEIAFHLNFSDDAHFVNFFRNKLRVPPARFRKEYLIAQS